jgi:hypothetical protein
MNSTYAKMAIGAVLFGTWVALVVFKTVGAEDLIVTIKLALAGLGGYHVRDRPPTTEKSQQDATS